MVVQILVLVDAHLDVISGLPAFSRISAGISNHKSFKLDLGLCLRQFVVVDDLMSQVGNVNSCIALTSDIEFVVLEVGELGVKDLQSFVVVLSNSAIIGFGASLGLTEADTSW